MKRLIVLAVLPAVILAGRLYADETFYGVKIQGDDYYVDKVWEALELIKSTSMAGVRQGQIGWWTFIKRSGVRVIQMYSWDTYQDYCGDSEDYSRVPGGFVKGGDGTIYLLEDDWTAQQYAELIIHETVHVFANMLWRTNRKAYRSNFGDSDGEEVFAEKLVEEFKNRVYMDNLSRSIQSYQYDY